MEGREGKRREGKGREVKGRDREKRRQIQVKSGKLGSCQKLEVKSRAF